MKKLTTGLIGLLTLSSVGIAQTVLIDFGSDSSYRGKSTSGNWNNASQAYDANLIDTSGGVTTIDFAPVSLGATDSFNGPAYSGQLAGWDFGGDTSAQQTALNQLASDTHTAINNSALGELGEGSAAMDFYSSTQGRFQLQQVTPGEIYSMTFYASKKFPANDTSTTFSVFDDSSYSNLLGSVTLSHGSGGTPNLDTTATISNLTGPSNSNNIFYVQYEGNNGGTGYINSMSLSVIPEPSSIMLVALTGIAGIAMLRRRRG